MNVPTVQIPRQSVQPVAMWSEEDIKLIRDTVARGATEAEFKLFLYQCKRTGLDPLARQIYAVKRWDAGLGRETMATQTSIDGFRLIAERSGKYAGQVGPFWCGEDGQWTDVWLQSAPPAAAKVGILREDFKEPCWGVARFASYVQKKKDGNPTSAWAKMGDVMIAKCAESLGFRKAFPQELSGIYTSDEMDQATALEPEQKVIPPHDPKTGEIIEPAKTKAPEPPKAAAPQQEVADKAKPHTLYADVNISDWRAFGQEFIAHIRAAESLAEIDQWEAFNTTHLMGMGKAVPRTKGLLNQAIAKRKAELVKPEELAMPTHAHGEPPIPLDEGIPEFLDRNKAAQQAPPEDFG